MAYVPPNNQPTKICPACRTLAYLDAGQCHQCGHFYSTRFNAPGQTVQPAQQFQAGHYAQPQVAYPVQQAGTGLAITAMVLGIVSVVLWCLPPLALFLGLLALIFGFVGYKQHHGMAVTGIILGGVHFIFWIGLFLFVALGAGVASGAAH